MRFLLWILVLLMLIGNVRGIDNNVDIMLLPSGAARESINIMFTANADADEIAYSLINYPENLKVYVNENEASYEIVENDLYDIVINKEVKRGEKYNIKLEFDIKGLIEQVDDKYIFSFRYEPEQILDNFNLNVKLPKGFVLAEIESAVSPRASNIETNGREINVEWELKNIVSEQAFIIVYERGITSSNNWITWIVVITALLIIMIVIWFYRKEKKEVIDNTLSHDEKKIKEMIEANAEVTQKQIVKDTGHSKAKISKLIRRLEEKGIVEKTPYMATNKLKIKNKIKR